MQISAGILFLSFCATNSEAPRPPVWSEEVSVNPARQTHRVFLTRDAHDLVLLLRRQGAANLTPVRVSLHNGIKPSVAVSVRATASGYQYDYTVSNGANARDSIIEFEIVVPAVLPDTHVAYIENGRENHNSWGGAAAGASVAKQIELDDQPGRYILWAAAWEEAKAASELVNILPGRAKSGFQIESRLRPGFTTGYTAGLPYAPPEDAFADSEIERQLSSLKIENYFNISTLTFGPMFLPDVADHEVLQNYRLGVSKLRKCPRLSQNEHFLEEVDQILNLPNTGANLAAALDQMTAKPGSQVERELLNCLRLIAKSFKEK